MTVERIRVPIPYVAHVVPRGARKPRPVCFRTEAVVGVRTAAASQLDVAVVTGGELGGNRRREYLGYDDWPSVSTPLQLAIFKPRG